MDTRHLLGGRKSRRSDMTASTRGSAQAVLFAANPVPDKPKLLEEELDELMKRTRNKLCGFVGLGVCVFLLVVFAACLAFGNWHFGYGKGAADATTKDPNKFVVSLHAYKWKDHSKDKERSASSSESARSKMSLKDLEANEMDRISGHGVNTHFMARCQSKDALELQQKIAKENGAVDEGDLRRLLGGGDGSGQTAASSAWRKFVMRKKALIEAVEARYPSIRASVQLKLEVSTRKGKLVKKTVKGEADPKLELDENALRILLVFTDDSDGHTLVDPLSPDDKAQIMRYVELKSVMLMESARLLDSADVQDLKAAGDEVYVPLADGWMEIYDKDSMQPYYWHKLTNKSTWVKPTNDASAEAAVVATEA